MTDYELEVIPQPKEGDVALFVFEGPKPFDGFFKGDGECNYLCGACREVLCRGVDRSQITGLVFKCPKCQSFNHIKGT